MKNIFIISILFTNSLMFSQTINLQIKDSIISYPVIIKHIGDSIRFKEYAYYKTDTTKIAWEFSVNNTALKVNFRLRA